MMVQPLIILCSKFYFLSKIFHKYLCVTAIAKFSDALLANLANALTCESQLVANLLESFFRATDSEALTDNGNLSLLKHFVKHRVEFLSP